MKNGIRKLIFLMIIISFVNSVYDVYLLVNLYNTRKEYGVILNKYSEDEERIYHLEKDMYYMQSLTLAQLVTVEDAIPAIEEQIENVNTEIRSLMRELEKQMETAEEKQIYHELYANYVSYKGEQELVYDIRNSDSLKTAHYYVNTVLQTKLTEMNNSLEQLTEIADYKINEIKTDLYANNRVTSIILTVIAAISILVMAGFTVYFVKYSGFILESFDIERQKYQNDVMNMQTKTIEGMAELVEGRDQDTGNHVKNSAVLVGMLAGELAKNDKYSSVITPEYIDILRRVAPLHDIGKIVISDTILLKPGKLTAEEYEIMKKHTVEGGRLVKKILEDIETEEHVKMASDIAMYHHEKWDGRGYPEGLSGEDIPLAARIMAVADVFEALISKRCYKDAFSVDEAYAIIEQESGSHFDADIVNAFVTLRPQIEKYLKEG